MTAVSHVPVLSVVVRDWLCGRLLVEAAAGRGVGRLVMSHGRAPSRPEICSS